MTHSAHTKNPQRSEIKHVMGFLDHLVDDGFCNLSILTGQQLADPYELLGESAAVYLRLGDQKATGTIVSADSLFSAPIKLDGEPIFWGSCGQIKFNKPVTLDLFQTRLVRSVHNDAVIGILVAGKRSEAWGMMIPAAEYKTGFFELNPDRASDPSQHVLRYRATRPPRPEPIKTFTTATFE